MLFLAVDAVRMTPIFSTLCLILGFIFWIWCGLKIRAFVKKPEEMERKHYQVQSKGKSVRAKILENVYRGDYEEKPVEGLLVEFLNLAGNTVRVKLEIKITKPYGQKYEAGSYLDLKLNREAIKPALTISGIRFESRQSPLENFWFAFNFIYMVIYFLLSYHFQSEGYGWRFISPIHPWVWLPLFTIFLLNISGDRSDGDYLICFYDFLGKNSKGRFEELILYGKSSPGYIRSFQRKNTATSDQPLYILEIG